MLEKKWRVVGSHDVSCPGMGRRNVESPGTTDAVVIVRELPTGQPTTIVLCPKLRESECAKNGPPVFTCAFII